MDAYNEVRHDAGVGLDGRIVVLDGNSVLRVKKGNGLGNTKEIPEPLYTGPQIAITVARGDEDQMIYRTFKSITDVDTITKTQVERAGSKQGIGIIQVAGTMHGQVNNL